MFQNMYREAGVWSNPDIVYYNKRVVKIQMIDHPAIAFLKNGC
jgi:hypothetical protein